MCARDTDCQAEVKGTPAASPWKGEVSEPGPQAKNEQKIFLSTVKWLDFRKLKEYTAVILNKRKPDRKCGLTREVIDSEWSGTRSAACEGLLRGPSCGTPTIETCHSHSPYTPGSPGAFRTHHPDDPRSSQLHKKEIPGRYKRPYANIRT